MKLYSTKKLSEISGEKKSTIAKRVMRMKIKGTFIGDMEVYFNKNQALRILNEHKKPSITKNPVKIKIIELYHARVGIKNIPRILNITKNASEMCIKEYRQTGFVVVESKINLNKIEL